MIWRSVHAQAWANDDCGAVSSSPASQVPSTSFAQPMATKKHTHRSQGCCFIVSRGLLFECLVGHVFISVVLSWFVLFAQGVPKALRCLSSVTGSRRRGMIDQKPALRQHCETSAVTKFFSSRSSASISIEGAPLTRAMKVDLLPDAPSLSRDQGPVG